MADENISDKIKEYMLKRQDFLQFEKDLFKTMWDLFTREVPVLNSILPSKYSIKSVDYHVSDIEGEPAIWIDIPSGAENCDSHKLTNNLNNLLADEYRRIQKRYGFRVLGFKVIDGMM